MTTRRELIELFCQMKEGWIPDVGTVYTITLDHGQRTALMGILQSKLPEDIRNAIIEECARVIDARVAPPGQMTAEDYEAKRCAKAVRELKQSSAAQQRTSEEK